ncbi:MAG: helix-turn-helix domain-containing protein [Magnetococcales bacterium]|nr:helix-turn-helix domain-containing protein [Magnetococcales bacterium]MBF0322703.1 helix-turn-helix domain-containing protein [Magnetococcales bacterium]
MEDLKSPIIKVASALKIRSEGMGLRATARVMGTHKNTISEWEKRFADQKETLMLYAFCHQFVSLTFEGDELYTIVGKRAEPLESKGWTAVIVERGSRFLVDQQCGVKDADLFTAVMSTVCQSIDQTQNLTFLSDGERRYGKILFSLCSEALQTGSKGRPPKVLPSMPSLKMVSSARWMLNWSSTILSVLIGRPEWCWQSSWVSRRHPCALKTYWP